MSVIQYSRRLRISDLQVPSSKQRICDYDSYLGNSKKTNDQPQSTDGGHKEKQPSSFELLLERAANMLNIWENIILNVSASDLANCLKVCKNMRSIIKQCLKTNSKLRHKVNCAATACTISKGWISFRMDAPFHHYMPKAVWALDGAWYDKTGRTVVGCSKDGLEFKLFHNAKCDSQPILNPDEGIIQPIFDVPLAVFIGDSSGTSLLRATHCKEDIIKLGKNNYGEAVEITPWFEEPRCVRYRLIQLKDPDWEEGYVVMSILNTKKEEITMSPHILYSFKIDQYHLTQEFDYIALKGRHLGSNDEAKMMTLLPHKLAVYDTTNASLLWQAECALNTHIIESIFINEKITGFVSRVSFGHYRGGVYDTATGSLITTLDFTTSVFEGKIKSKDIIRTRGPYICYSQSMDFYVIKASHNKTKKFKFPFPVGQFKKDILHFYRANTKFLVPKYFSLLGFVGKTNVLLSQLWFERHDKPLLVSLDIEAAIAADKNEQVGLAFSLPLVDHDEDFSFKPCYTGYTPMYKTDVDNGQVNMVGVSCPTWKNSYKNYFFVCGMQY